MTLLRSSFGGLPSLLPTRILLYFEANNYT